MTFKILYERMKTRSDTCQFFIEEFIETTNRATGDPNWQNLEIPLEVISSLRDHIQESFMMTCARRARVEKDPVYEEATEVVRIFCEIVSAEYKINLVATPVLSITEVMEQEGFIEIIEGPDDERCVKPISQ